MGVKKKPTVHKKQMQKQKQKQKPPPQKQKQPQASAGSAGTPDEAKKKGYYFDNYKVEQLLTRYVDGACIDIELRDAIMENATELIRQVIRTHNLHNLYPGREQSSFNDLCQIGWNQIESTLYKFDSSPGHTRVFNLWSQVAKTVILAHIKKETRDKRNQNGYRKHQQIRAKAIPRKLDRFLQEAAQVCKYNEDYSKLVKCVRKLYERDDRPYEAMVFKLVKLSRLSRQRVSGFLKFLRLRSMDFTDAGVDEPVIPDIKPTKQEFEEDD